MTEKSHTGIWVALIAVALIAIGAYFHSGAISFGSTGTRFPDGVAVGKNASVTSQSLTVGANGLPIKQLGVQTCYIQPYATTIAASSTALADCQGTAAVGSTNTKNDTALTGVTFGDNVYAQLSTTTAGTTFLGLTIIGATASTTPGYIQLDIANNTGATYTWPTTGTASGTVSYIDKN